MLEFILKKRKVVLLFIIMLFLVGIITFFQLPRREIPETELALATITAIYPGARAELVESLVTNRIEEKLTSIAEIEEVTSVSKAEVSQVIISLAEGVDKERVWNQVRQRLKEAEDDFPEGVSEASFNDDLNMHGVSLYQLTADKEEDLYQLSSILEHWERRFLQVPGISRVNIQGMPEREVLISVNAERANYLQIPLARILETLRGEVNLTAPGSWELSDYHYQLRADSYKQAAELEELIVFKRNNGELIRLGDIATVRESFKPITEVVNYQGRPAVSLSFFLNPGVDRLKIDRELNRLMQEMQNQLPRSVEVVKVYSQAGPVKELFADLAEAFLIAMLLVLLTCSLGFNLISAFSVMLSIPLSLSLGIIAAPLLGVDMNQITLIGFIIVLGILVDDSIVVNENIERHLRSGQEVFLSCINGTKEVMTSVISSTVIIVFTFFPLLFLSGASGDFARPLPTVIIFSIIASAIVALSIIPIYRQHIAEKYSVWASRTGYIGRVLEQTATYYAEKIVPFLIRKPKTVVLLIISLGFSIFLLIPFTPLEFFPDTEREEVFIEMKLPEGTTIEKTTVQAKQLQDWILNQEEVREVSAFIGTPMPRLFGMTSSQGNVPNQAMFLVYINKDKALASTLKDQWNNQLIEQFPQAEFTTSVVESGPPVGTPIAIRVKGQSFEELRLIGQEIRALLLQQPGVNSVSDDVGKSLATLSFQPKREALQQWGVSNQAITQVLRLYGEGLPIGEFSADQTLLDMRVEYKFEKGTPLDNLHNMFVLSPTGEAIPLTSLVDVSSDFTVQNIPHHNYIPSLTVRGYLESNAKEDRILNNMGPELERIRASYPNSIIEIVGETSARTDFFMEIGKIFVIVLFLILIVMAIQFYSLLIPLLIMSTVFLGTAGAILVLFITQTGLGFMSLMGIVSLAGISVRNGVILVDFMEQRRKNGAPLAEAVQEACQKRLKPVILTSLTTILGVMPLILSNILMFKPLAIAIAGGLMFSTCLTLFLLPALYVTFVAKRFLGNQPDPNVFRPWD
ncbi:MAG: efflux RND transporter permease subunit [Syntrophomonadaceae bacterium]|nr:efflux RND transporter permease subunit [Syntrophomonadaceae bacterium]